MGAHQSNSNGPLLVEGSHELQTWTVLDQGTVLSDLNHQGISLIHNMVKFGAFDGEYLRITWPTSNAELKAQNIIGKFTRHQTLDLPWRQASRKCEQETANECWFDIGRGPAEALQLFMGNGQFTQNTTPPYPTRVAIKWRPLYLAFVAQDKGPYRIVFGSEQAGSSTGRTIDNLIKRRGKKLLDLEVVPIGTVAPNTIRDTIWTRDRMQTYVLWGVLLIGVAVMLWIAIGLFQQMTQSLARPI